MNIVVGFSRAKASYKVGSEAIQIVEKRNFSHVYIKYQCIVTGKLIIAQAAHGFVHEVTEKVFVEHNIIVREYQIECNNVGYTSALCFVRDNLGMPYSMSQLFWIGVKKLFRIPITINNKDSAFICSEFAARVCTILGVGIGSIENLDTFTPSDLNELLLKLSKEHSSHLRVCYE